LKFIGGCLCGALRYESKLEPLESGYCHCSICRKSTSAPVVAFAAFPIEQFSYSKGTPAIYASSPTGQREFCHQCGTQICHRGSNQPTTVDVNLGTMDDMSLVTPKYHIYTDERIQWFEIDDHLPRFGKGEV